MSDYLDIARKIMGCQPRAARHESVMPLEEVLKRQPLELWSDSSGERFWLVADEDDATLLGTPRGTIYTAAEAHLVVQMADPDIVAEVHRWKRQFNARLREFQRKNENSD